MLCCPHTNSLRLYPLHTVLESWASLLQVVNAMEKRFMLNCHDFSISLSKSASSASRRGWNWFLELNKEVFSFLFFLPPSPKHAMIVQLCYTLRFWRICVPPLRTRPALRDLCGSAPCSTPILRINTLCVHVRWNSKRCLKNRARN